jgi:hypothetical protein
LLVTNHTQTHPGNPSVLMSESERPSQLQRSSDGNVLWGFISPGGRQSTFTVRTRG